MVGFGVYIYVSCTWLRECIGSSKISHGTTVVVPHNHLEKICIVYMGMVAKNRLFVVSDLQSCDEPKLSMDLE